MVVSIAYRDDIKDAELVTDLWNYLYKGQYKIIDIRRVFYVVNQSGRKLLGLKVGQLIKWAGFDPNKPVYCRIDQDEIVIRQDGNGVQRKIAKSGEYYKICIDNLIRAIGINEPDKVLIKVKNGELRISNIKKEKNKLDLVKRLLKGESDVGKTDFVGDYLI